MNWLFAFLLGWHPPLEVPPTPPIDWPEYEQVCCDWFLNTFLNTAAVPGTFSFPMPKIRECRAGHRGAKYAGGRYKADKRPNDGVWVEAKPGMSCFSTCFEDEEAARRWLGDRGLRASKARQLLDAELRGTGPMADSRHPNRVES